MLNSSCVNKVILLGHVAENPRWHVVHNKRTLCLKLVTEETLKKNGVPIIHQEVHQVKVSGMLLNNVSLEKGQQLYVQGKIQTRQFIDEQNVKHYRAEINADAIEVMGVQFAPEQEAVAIAVSA